MVEALPGTYKVYAVEEVVEKVVRARLYFDRSGGGVTLSGGEPFFQFDFIRELLCAIKRAGIHTAVDTCLYTSPDKIRELSEYVDLFLVGLKHIDSHKHKELTGQDNGLILENISYLNSLKKPFWLRYVVIPGITDDEADVRRLVEYFSRFNNLECVELLPYHRLGLKKWESLGKPYGLPHVEPPTREEMAQVERLFEHFNVSLPH
jgi:pyruvate formate lyase activating enzyme